MEQMVNVENLKSRVKRESQDNDEKEDSKEMQDHKDQWEKKVIGKSRS